MTSEESMGLVHVLPRAFAQGDRVQSGVGVIRIPEFHKTDVCFQNGYTSVYSQTDDLADADVEKSCRRYPKRGEFNYLFYLATAPAYYLQHGGCYTFSRDVANSINGYPKGAIVGYLRKVGGDFRFNWVESCKDDNVDDFTADERFIDGVSWKMKDFCIFPNYDEMVAASFSSGSWTAPIDCWVYTSATAFQDCILSVNGLAVSECYHTKNLNHGSTSWTNQLLATKGDVFTLSNADAIVSISYCPLRQ